jgi:RNA-directed DNA polymerase
LNYGSRLALSGLPIIFDGKHFSKLVGYDPNFVFGVSNAPGRYYRTFKIPKKSGGERKIAEPLPSLKEIQRWILVHILEKIKPESAAKAYIKGLSLKDNARFHRKQPIVLHLDIKDFFPSINRRRIFTIFRSLGYSTSVAKPFEFSFKIY